MEQQLEAERWWPRSKGMISASLVVRGDEAPAEMRGAWAKWNRAVEHYNDLRRTAAEWLTRAWSIECAYDPGLGNHVASFRVHDDDLLERLRIGAIAGDCFHNLRSAVDFVMWELIHQQARLTGVAVPKRPPVFPLAIDGESESAFERRVRKMPVSDRAMGRILEVHDFGENGAMPYMRYLRILSNNDKHRTGLVAMASVDVRTAKFAVHPPGPEPRTEFTWNPGDEWGDGTRLAVVRFDEGPQPDHIVRVVVPPASLVTLKYPDGSATVINLWTMTGVLLVVQDVLDRLQELFPSQP